MESYQSIGIVIGIIGIVLGLLGSLAYGWLVWVAVVSIVGIIIVLVNTKHHQGVGITLIVLGILGNLLLLIPGIMAYRYKPESESEIKPQIKEKGGIAAYRYKPESASEIKPQSKEEGEKVIRENKTKTHLIIVIAIIASVSFGIFLVMSLNQMNQNLYDAISGIPSSTPSYGEIQQMCYDKIKEQGITEPTETAVNICAGMVMDSLNK